MQLVWYIFILTQRFLILWLLTAAYFNGKISAKILTRFKRLQRMRKRVFYIHTLQAMQISSAIIPVFAALMEHYSRKVEKEVRDGFLFLNISPLNLICTKVLVKKLK